MASIAALLIRVVLPCLSADLLIEQGIDAAALADYAVPVLWMLATYAVMTVVGAAGAADWLIRYGLAQAGIEVQFSFLIAAMVIIWLIVNELISILENVAAMGGPVPSFLSKLLARLKNVVEKKAEDEQHEDT